jgi:hypothetical protein
LKRIKNWLRIKLKKFLDIEVLERDYKHHKEGNRTDFDWLQKDIRINRNEINNVGNSLKKDINHFQESVNTLHTTVENVVHIGTDVRYDSGSYTDGHSWAVICIEGKLNIVKFVKFDRSNAMDLLRYLKQYEAGRHCIDTPYSEIFYDGFFKF